MSKILHFTELGARSAPPVILLHSIATSADLWALQMPIWASRFRVIAMDLPGHGRSPPLGGEATIANMAQSVALTCESLGIRSAAFVGLSLGSMVVQHLAASRSDLVTHAVLSNGVSATPAHIAESWRQRIADCASGGMESQVEATLERWFTGEFRAGSPMILGWVADMIRTTSVEGYCQACEALSVLDQTQLLTEIACPTLVLAGEQDAAAPRETLEQMADTIAKAQFEALPTRHISNVQKPIEYAELVGSFLSSA